LWLGSVAEMSTHAQRNGGLGAAPAVERDIVGRMSPISMNDAEALSRLRERRVMVDLTSPNRTPQKAITVAGRCFSALLAAGVPDDERRALMELLATTAREAATADRTSADALVEGMNHDGTRLLKVAQQYLVVTVNWKHDQSEP
jgi:hypothetical protein